MPSPGERVILNEGGVMVTPARMVVGEKTYPIAHISGVEYEKKKTGVLGAILLLSGVVWLVLFLPCGLMFLVMGAVFIAQAGSHVVKIETGGKEIEAFKAKRADLPQRVVAALNDAISSQN